VAVFQPIKSPKLKSPKILGKEGTKSKIVAFVRNLFIKLILNQIKNKSKTAN